MPEENALANAKHNEGGIPSKLSCSNGLVHHIPQLLHGVVHYILDVDGAAAACGSC